MPDRRAICLVANQLDSRTPCPIELLPGYILRRPTQEELTTILPAIQQIADVNPSRIYFEQCYGLAQFKSSSPPSDQEIGQSGYFVIETPLPFRGISGFPKIIEQIESVSRLLPSAHLHLPMFLMSNNSVRRYDYELGTFRHCRLLNANDSRPWPSSTELHQVQELLEKLHAITIAGPSRITTAFEVFADTNNIPANHKARFLGLIQVIEALLCRSSDDHGSSLSHQISTKILLLQRRFGSFSPSLSTLNLRNKPNKSNDELLKWIWRQIYSCRSSITHGGRKATDSAAIEYESVTPYVECATKALLCFSFREPQLVLDLAEV